MRHCLASHCLSVLRLTVFLCCRKLKVSHKHTFERQDNDCDDDDVADAPVCDDSQEVVFGVSENETVTVSCSVQSYPPADTFTWSFNNSLTSSLLPSSSFTSSRGSSVISYTPHSHMDFGTLLCWGTNMVGNQQTNRPCVFHIIPTGKIKKAENSLLNIHQEI